MQLILGSYVFSPLFESVRIVIGLMMVLFWPGYCLQACLFPQRKELEGWERVALSFGLSIGVAAVIAPVMDRLPWGVRFGPVVIAYVAFILICTGMRDYRRRDLPETDYPGALVKLNVITWWKRMDGGMRKIYAVQAAAVFTAVGVLVVNTFLPHPGEQYTEFYILGVDGLAQGFIREVSVGEMVEMMCGIANHEGTAAQYRIEVRHQGDLIGGRGPFVLQHGEVVEVPVGFAALSKGENVKFDFLLMREATERPYRTLVLWMDVDE